MKKFLAFLVSVILVLSMFSAMALPSIAGDEEINPSEWLANHIQSVNGDWLTRRLYPGHLGKEEEFTPAGGYYYDNEGFHTTSPDYTNMTPAYAVISKETWNLKKGFSMTFRIDDFSYKGDNNADEWIAITIGDNQLLTPGITKNGCGSGWVGLNRGSGNGSTSTESFWSHEKDEDGNGGAFTPQGRSFWSPCDMEDGKEIYTLDVSWDGSAYTIKVNGETITGNANISNNLKKLNRDGNFYIGIMFHSGVINGTAALTITDVNGSTPTGTDNVEADENTLVYGDLIDSSTVEVNQPALLFDANKETFKKDPDMQNCTVQPNGDGSYTIYSVAAASFITWSVKNSITYNAEDFPVFCMLVKNLDGMSGILYQLSGDNLSAGPNCGISWDMYDYDEEKYEREWLDDDDNYWNLIVVDLTSGAVSFENTGRLHGCRVDFGGLDTTGEEPFDLMYMAYFRTEAECQAYAEQYLTKAGVIDGGSIGDTETEYPSTEPATEPATEPTTEPTKALYVVAEHGTLRKELVLSDSNVLNYVAEGDILQAIGENSTWYCIQYGQTRGYINKRLVCEASILDGFTAVNETVVLSANANVRCIPSSEIDDYAWRGQLMRGDSVVRTGISETGWSRIEYTYEGKVKEYYIRTDCIGSSTELPTEPATDPVTEPATDPVTDPATDPVTDPATEPVTDPVTEPATEPVTDPIIEPATEPATDPVTEPETEPETEPVTEPETKPTSETESETETKAFSFEELGCSSTIGAGAAALVLSAMAAAVALKKRE